MKFLMVVISILILLFGLRVLGSTLLNSILGLRIEGIDYRIIPSLLLLVFAVPVCISRIFANARFWEVKKDIMPEKKGGIRDER